jgi:hypothetical protein
MDWRGVGRVGFRNLYYLLNNEIFRCFLHYKVLKCSDAPMCERSFSLLERKDSYTNPDCIISQLADSQRCQLRKEAEKLANF